MLPPRPPTSKTCDATSARFPLKLKLESHNTQMANVSSTSFMTR
jgi:hypothetical protein